MINVNIVLAEEGSDIGKKNQKKCVMVNVKHTIVDLVVNLLKMLENVVNLEVQTAWRKPKDFVQDVQTITIVPLHIRLKIVTPPQTNQKIVMVCVKIIIVDLVVNPRKIGQNVVHFQ